MKNETIKVKEVIGVIDINKMLNDYYVKGRSDCLKRLIIGGLIGFSILTISKNKRINKKMSEELKE